MIRRLSRRVGRRGGFLAFLALLHVLYGYSLLAAPATALGPYSLGFPVWVWAVLWITSGVACVVSAPLTGKADRGGFAAAAVIDAGWACLWAHLWIVQGFPRGWVSLVVWSTFSGVVMMVSGWPEPPRPGDPL